jgi:ADP-dependent NAD(P)H-hydrate dehydratase / NAD(P)H-hydrate epimerase
MKIFKSSEIKEVDAYTIENEPIQSINLMERASDQIAQWIINEFDTNQHVIVFVGPGNNGGDGLAIARMLYNYGYIVKVYILKITDKLSRDAEINLNRLLEETNLEVFNITEENDIPIIPEDSLVLDAIFGSGLARPVDGLPAKIVQHINSSLSFVLAVDIPSGLFGEDNSDNVFENIIKADYTLSFEFPKLSFFIADYEEYVGEFEILPIGLHPQIIEEKESDLFFLEKEYVLSKLRNRLKFAHKGSYGHALLVSGSYGKMGAAILASKACLRTGVGLLTIHIPQSGYEILQTAVPEAMVCIDESESCFCGKQELEKYSAIGIGPGIGIKKSIQDAFKEMISNTNRPLVIDADGINILAENKELLNELPNDTILTPHPKEFERIAGISKNAFNRLQLQIEMAKKYEIYIILKGAHTSIASPNGECYFNSTGNPGMASGGSGDVLTGIILSFLAQGYSAKEACLLGVYLHGLAGDIASDTMSEEAMIATDIIENLGLAFKEIRQIEF